MPDCRELFGRHALRCTRQRAVVYEALAACKSHPTAEQLHQMVSPCCEGLSLATVYNTLEALVKAGLARRIVPPTGGNGGARYDADLSDHLHVMTGDGRILDVPQDLSESILSNLPDSAIRELERRMGVRIGKVSISLVEEAHPDG